MRSLGSEQSLQLFPPATWSGTDMTPTAPADYPGMRPTGSWQLEPDGELRGLQTDGQGWSDRETGAAVDLADRHLVLAYGSNPDVDKLLSQPDFFDGQSVIALRAAVIGWAAVWCDARRHRDGSVIATLMRMPGRVEVHPVLALTGHQLATMDEWEGHPHSYYRATHSGVVVLENDQSLEAVDVYYGTSEKRPVLIVEGQALLCTEIPHAVVDSMVARPAGW